MTNHKQIQGFTNVFCQVFLLFCTFAFGMANEHTSNIQHTHIILDPGHGGSLPGNVHFGIEEKNINLSISLKIAKHLESLSTKFSIQFTRTQDKSLSLENRVKIATQTAKQYPESILLSIHTNGSRNPKAKGMETFFYADFHPKQAIPNHRKQRMQQILPIAEPSLMNILLKLFDLHVSEQSFLLAHHVHNHAYSFVKQKTEDRGVKAKAFYMVKNLPMPAILVEVGFLSNKQECQALSSNKYQNKIAKGIVAGLLHYFKTQSRP